MVSVCSGGEVQFQALEDAVGDSVAPVAAFSIIHRQQDVPKELVVAPRKAFIVRSRHEEEWRLRRISALQLPREDKVFVLRVVEGADIPQVLVAQGSESEREESQAGGKALRPRGGAVYSDGGGQRGPIAQVEAQFAGAVDRRLLIRPAVNRGEQPGHVLDYVNLARVVMNFLVATEKVVSAVGGEEVEPVDHAPLSGARVHAEKIEHALADLKLATQRGERHRPRKSGLVVGKPNEAA